MASRSTAQVSLDDQISIETHVEAVDLADDADWEHFTVPREIKESFPVMTALNSLLDGRGCLELWRSAESRTIGS